MVTSRICVPMSGESTIVGVVAEAGREDDAEHHDEQRHDEEEPGADVGSRSRLQPVVTVGSRVDIGHAAALACSRSRRASSRTSSGTPLPASSRSSGSIAPAASSYA